VIVANDLLGASGKWQAIKEHSFPRKLGLTCVRQFVLAASLNSGVDNGFNDYLGAKKIYSRRAVGFFVAGI